MYQASKGEIICKLADNFENEPYLSLLELLHLINSFTNGIYKVHHDNSREELLAMPSFYDSVTRGRDASISRKPKEKEKFQFSYDFSASVDANGNVLVHLEEIDLADVPKGDTRRSHEWFFPSNVIINYLNDHPLSINDQPSREGLIRQTIDYLVIPMRKSREQVISTDEERETITEISFKAENGEIDFSKAGFDTAIALKYRYDCDRLAFCYAMLKVFKNIHPRDFYGSEYDIIVKLRGQPRFLHLLPVDPDNPNVERINPFYAF